MQTHFFFHLFMLGLLSLWVLYFLFYEFKEIKKLLTYVLHNIYFHVHWVGRFCLSTTVKTKKKGTRSYRELLSSSIRNNSVTCKEPTSRLMRLSIGTLDEWGKLPVMVRISCEFILKVLKTCPLNVKPLIK